MKRVLSILSRITANCLGLDFRFICDYDNRNYSLINGPTGTIKSGRIYIQVAYKTECTKLGQLEEWKGRKYYLSDYMTDDEIVKTAYVAFKTAVEHEVMEGFKVDNIILFNPHIDFEELLIISSKEVRRE
jgi:hypothetical protein